MHTAPILSSSARIAHLSDLHVTAEPTGLARSVLELSTRFVSAGRSLDSKDRSRKVRSALAAARDAGAGHFVISGDLTEVGTPEEFETLAEVLLDTNIDPALVTLVPGNHDAYTRADAWSQALAGPLAPFRLSSAHTPGAVVDREHAVFLPVDVACHQHFTRAAGELSADDAHALEMRVAALAGRGRPVVIVLHHSPLPHWPRAWQWLHGLRGGRRLLDLLKRYPDVHVLHGHLHYEVELAFGDRGAHIFGAPAVIDDAHDAPRVRLYDVSEATLSSAAACPPRAPASRRAAAA